MGMLGVCVCVLNPILTKINITYQGIYTQMYYCYIFTKKVDVVVEVEAVSTLELKLKAPQDLEVGLLLIRARNF